MPLPSTRSAGCRRELVWAGCFALLLAAVFGGTIHADFVQWDDDINIYDNPGIRGLDGEHLRWMFTDVSYVRRYLPLGWLSWAVLYQCLGLTPAAFHLANVVLHAANALLLFFILRHLLSLGKGQGAGPVEGSKILWAAGAGACFWAIHPLRTEVVAWASGLLYCQALFFLLAAFWAYLRYVAATEPRTRRPWYGLAVLAYAASLLTYPIGLGGLAVFVLVDFYPLRRLGWDWRSWRSRRAAAIFLEKAPLAAVAGLVLGVTVWSRIHAAGLWKAPAGVEEFGVYARVMQAFYIWGCYVWKTVLPLGLAPLYTTLVSFDPDAGLFWMSAALVAGLSAWLYWKRRVWPAAWVAWLSYLALLVPMLGLTEHPHFPSDRYSYLPGAAWGVAAAALVWSARPRGPWGRWMGAAAGSGLLFLAVLSVRQCRVWESSETLFGHMLRTVDDETRRYDTLYRLGQYRMGTGEFAEAAEAFRAVLALRVGHVPARAQLGNALALQGRLGKAAEVYAQVLELAPSHRNARFNLAQALVELGRGPEAEGHYRILLEADQADAQVHEALGRWLMAAGRIEEGLAHQSEARRLELAQGGGMGVREVGRSTGQDPAR